MSWFGTLKKIVNFATLGSVTFFEQQIEYGGALVTAAIDLKNQIVRIGEDVFRAAPGELFFPGVGPLAGILKHEVEDELIFLSPLGIVTSVVAYAPVDPLGTIIVVGDLVGKIQHRTLRPKERQIAEYVFGDDSRDARPACGVRGCGRRNTQRVWGRGL
jgi:hypothetical protein